MIGLGKANLSLQENVFGGEESMGYFVGLGFANLDTGIADYPVRFDR